jgi:hypothetical protein
MGSKRTGQDRRRQYRAAPRAGTPERPALDHQAGTRADRGPGLNQSRREEGSTPGHMKERTVSRSGRIVVLGDGGRVPLLSLRSAFILTVALLASTVTGALTFLMSASLPGAFLAAGPACVTVIMLLNAIIG